ncbi:MAG: hypothetical protein AB1486_26230 [Planctomycetota bacterium]
MRPHACSLLLVLAFLATSWAGEPVIVDHGSAVIPDIPPHWIERAKSNLHIAYGHTSHGSQLTDGMTGLITFTGGCGGPQFAWNNGGSEGALDLHDYAMDGDCGYYPEWVDNTRAYLDDPANSDCNVIIWAWCGQVSGYSEQDMIDRYLVPMSQLEADYPHVKFVYMTGHLNYWERENTNARNQQIRDYCIANAKILYDFADIESYDPDGTYFPYATDSCDYWDAYGNYQGNWAVEWQSTHVQDVEWYDCPSAHSQPLNANLKAYAAWWLWCRLAGWSGHHELNADGWSIPASTGGTISFALEAGVAQAGRGYVLLGSVSGTEPGWALPGGLATLPLNWDAFTSLVLRLLNSPAFAGFFGTLDGWGLATARFDTLGPVPPEFVGVRMYYAYFLLGWPMDFASNAVEVDIVP